MKYKKKARKQASKQASEEGRKEGGLVVEQVEIYIDRQIDKYTNNR